MHKDFRKGDKDSLLFIERKKPSVKTGKEIDEDEDDISVQTPISTASSGTEKSYRSAVNK